MWSVWGSMAITSNLQQNTVNQDLVSTPVCFVTGRSLILVTLYYFPGVPSLQLTQGGIECHLGLMFCWLLVLKWQVIGLATQPTSPSCSCAPQENGHADPYQPVRDHHISFRSREAPSSASWPRCPVGLRTVTRKPNLVGGFFSTHPPKKKLVQIASLTQVSGG